MPNSEIGRIRRFAPDNALTFRVRPLSPVVSIKSKAEEILIDLVTPSTERVIWQRQGPVGVLHFWTHIG